MNQNRRGTTVKKKRTLPLVLACALMLSSCTAAPVPSGETLPESVPAAASAPAGGSESAAPAPFALNGELVALLEEDNAALKQMRQGSCYAEIPGRGTARVLYFEPFLDVQMIPPEEGAFAAWREGYGDGGYLENPFVDDLAVLELIVEDEIDPLAPAVLSQDSLRQLFATDALITYPLLCDGLGQTPELTHSETVCYLAPRRENWPMGSDPGLEIAGGEWHADFSVDELRLTVGFIRVDDEYVAWRATLSEE